MLRSAPCREPWSWDPWAQSRVRLSAIRQGLRLRVRGEYGALHHHRREPDARRGTARRRKCRRMRIRRRLPERQSRFPPSGARRRRFRRLSKYATRVHRACQKEFDTSGKSLA